MDSLDAIIIITLGLVAAISFGLGLTVGALRSAKKYVAALERISHGRRKFENLDGE